MNNHKEVRRITTAAASVPASAITRLAMYYLSLGLKRFGTTNKTPGKSSELLTQAIRKLDLSTLAQYGIKKAWVVNPNSNVVYEFISSVRQMISKNVADDPDVSQEELKLIRFASLFAMEPSKPGYFLRARQAAAKISNAYMKNFDTVLNSIGGGASVDEDVITVGSKANVADLYDKQITIVASLLGSRAKANQIELTVEQQKTLAEKSPEGAELVKQYKAVKRQIMANYDLDFSAYTAKSKEPIPLHIAYKAMASMGYRSQRLPNFGKPVPLRVGTSGGKLKFFTESGKPLAMGIPQNATEVTFSKIYNDADGKGLYVSYKAPLALKPTRVYTELHAVSAVEKKFGLADQINENIDSILVKWKRDLSAEDDMTMMAATVCMLVYFTSARAGTRQFSAASATGVPTYGILSLRPRHVKITSSNVIIAYNGKKNVPQKHILPLKGQAEKLIARNLEELLEGKSRTSEKELVFSMKASNGAVKIFNDKLLKTYLEKTGYPAGIHKLRHVRGTNLVADLLAQKNYKPVGKNLASRQKDAEAWMITNILTPAANLLGHKSGDDKSLWRTTVKSYLNPNIIVDWFDKQELRKPSWLPTALEAKAD